MIKDKEKAESANQFCLLRFTIHCCAIHFKAIVQITTSDETPGGQRFQTKRAHHKIIRKIKNPKFSERRTSDLSKAFRSRVNTYFKTHNIHKHANSSMVGKTFLMSALFFMPSTEFPLPDEEGVVAGDWSTHQLATTTNFSPNSRFFSWLIGGLNYQIEHHLLPHICHIHYRRISGIVADTAREFGIPYHTKANFFVALRDHARTLYKLGRMEPVPID